MNLQPNDKIKCFGATDAVSIAEYLTSIGIPHRITRNYVVILESPKKKNGFGERIRQARQDVFFTSAEIAEELGIERKEVLAWEQEKRFPSDEDLKAFCDLVEANENYIREGKK